MQPHPLTKSATFQHSPTLSRAESLCEQDVRSQEAYKHRAQVAYMEVAVTLNQVENESICP